MGCAYGMDMVKSDVSSEISVPDTDTRVPFHSQHLVTRRIARGSYTRVYAAYRYEKDDEGKNTEVVVKIKDLRPKRKNAGQASASKAALAVQKEADILARVSRQQNCVSCIDHCVEGHFSYLVMEKCDMTLQQMFEQLPVVTESVLARTFVQMLHALASIHETGIVHRDVKPDNFLISGCSVVKLTDCALAEVLSPEMLSGMFYDTKTDIWSFAVSIYVLLLGQFPYCPAERTSASMKQAIIDGKTVDGQGPWKRYYREKAKATDQHLGGLRNMLHMSRRSRTAPKAGRKRSHEVMVDAQAVQRTRKKKLSEAIAARLKRQRSTMKALRRSEMR